MTQLSDQQEDIVGLPLTPLAITACAGSGKTMTATHRLAGMRRMLADNHSVVALLSFSNVAVDEFRRTYSNLRRAERDDGCATSVEIDTMDGFITTNVLRPHGHRTMRSSRMPFLVEGREPFLKSFTVFDGSRSHPTADLRIRIKGGEFEFDVGGHSPNRVFAQEAERALNKLGNIGAYTHESARYWVLRTFREHPFTLRVMSKRYPHILIDEAQDISTEHQAILELLVQAGSQLSLIGDCNQAIYEFSGADGAFLASYGSRKGVTAKELNRNYRSVPALVEVANHISSRRDVADRPTPTALNGAFYIPFDKSSRDKTLATFGRMCVSAEIDTKEAAVICRSRDWADTWSGAGDRQGQGVVRCFVDAAICRDRLKRMGDAFEQACVGVAGLLASQHQDLLSHLSRPKDPVHLGLRKAIWRFVRDPQVGLPAGSLLGATEWHPIFSARVKDFVHGICRDFGLQPGENLGQRLAKKALENRPLVEQPDLGQTDVPLFRVSTVHKVKGESLSAVMYVASKEHVRALLDGTASEIGRIGYVAVTRARNLFVLALPENCISQLEEHLVSAGFRRPGITLD